MRLVGFEADGKARLGVVEGAEIIDLQAIAPEFPADLAEILRRDELGLAAIAGLASRAKPAHRRKFAGLDLALPVQRPGKILCLGLNYHDHAREGGNKSPTTPRSSCAARRLSSRMASRSCAHAFPTSSTTRPRWSP